MPSKNRVPVIQPPSSNTITAQHAQNPHLAAASNLDKTPVQEIKKEKSINIEETESQEIKSKPTVEEKNIDKEDASVSKNDNTASEKKPQNNKKKNTANELPLEDFAKIIKVPVVYAKEFDDAVGKQNRDIQLATVIYKEIGNTIFKQSKEIGRSLNDTYNLILLDYVLHHKEIKKEQNLFSPSNNVNQKVKTHRQQIVTYPLIADFIKKEANETNRSVSLVILNILMNYYQI